MSNALVVRDEPDGGTTRMRFVLPAVRLALFAFALIALRRQLHGLDLEELRNALLARGGSHLAVAMGCTILSFVALGAIELLAIRAVGDEGARRLSVRRVLSTSMVAQAFAHAVGVALLTAAAVRQRAYERHVSNPITVARITTFVAATELLGLLAVGSIALLSGTATGFAASPFAARTIGAALAALVLLYLTTSAKDAVKRWVRPPTRRAAALQLGISAFDWLVTASVLFAVLPTTFPISYSGFLSAYVAAQTAAMLSQVPAGAGVFEATFLALLSTGLTGDVRAGIAASLLTYRAVYYLVPLIVAAFVALIFELRQPR